MSGPSIRLIAIAERYLEALVAHEPAAVPLAAGFRATENTAPVKPGEGLWGSVMDFPGRQFFADPESGQVVVMGAAQLVDVLRPFALRLRVAGGEICESEIICSTDAHGHFSEVRQLLKPDVLYDAPVPAHRACNREQLQAAADSYWVALSESDGSLARFGYRCDRFANGKKITNTLTTLLSPDAAVHTCASCVTATRPARPKVPERRFPVLDVERGVAATFVIVEFSQNATNPRPDTGAFYMLGVFKVVDGEFRVIDEIHHIMPPGTRSGW